MLNPRILSQPPNRTILVGGSSALRVTATGTAPLEYQWFFNGNPLPGAASFSLLMTKVQHAAAGEYHVVVTDSTGSVTSDIADPAEFNRIISTNATGTTMATLNSWIEGVVWNPANGGGVLLFSDVDGRVWSSAGDGVAIFAPDGHWIGTIRMTRTANLCFGGPSYKTLYTVGQPEVSSIPVLVPGAVAVKRLTASRQGNQINLAWPVPSTGFLLQESRVPGDPETWTNVTTPPAMTDGSNTVTVEANQDSTYYRLILP